MLRCALEEKSADRQADTEKYGDKFAFISGKLYLLRHKDDVETIYREDRKVFALQILADA